MAQKRGVFSHRSAADPLPLSVFGTEGDGEYRMTGAPVETSEVNLPYVFVPSLSW